VPKPHPSPPPPRAGDRSLTLLLLLIPISITLITHEYEYISMTHRCPPEFNPKRSKGPTHTECVELVRLMSYFSRNTPHPHTWVRVNRPPPSPRAGDRSLSEGGEFLLLIITIIIMLITHEH